MSLPTSPCSVCSVALASFHQAGRAECEELISSRCVCVRLHPKMSNHRLPLDSWQQRENKTAAAFIAENTKLTRLPNKPRRRSFISGRKCSRLHSKESRVGSQTARRCHALARWKEATPTWEPTPDPRGWARGGHICSRAPPRSALRHQ